MNDINKDLLNIPIVLTVELGRKKMPIRDILKLNNTTVTQLNKKTDEPLDIFANGLLIAQGIIVTVNGKFGIKITNIVEPGKRLKLKKS